jgi:hypothetical protein
VLQIKYIDEEFPRSQFRFFGDGSNRTEILTDLFYPVVIALDTVNR